MSDFILKMAMYWPKRVVVSYTSYQKYPAIEHVKYE